MFWILTVMFCGIACGFLLRKRTEVLRVVSRLLMPVICILLFVMGLMVGQNEMVMENLSSLGFEALLLTIGALLGSILLAKLVYIRWFKAKGNNEK